MYSIVFLKSLSLIINKQQKCTIILLGINFIGQSWALNKQYVIEFQQARAINFLLSFKKVFFSSLWVHVQHSALVGRVRGQWAIFSSSKVSFQKFSIEVVVDRHLVKNMLSSLNSIKILVFGQVSKYMGSRRFLRSFHHNCNSSSYLSYQYDLFFGLASCSFFVYYVNSSWATIKIYSSKNLNYI